VSDWKRWGVTGELWALGGGEGLEDITRRTKAAVPARTPKRLRRQVEDVVGRIALGRLTMSEGRSTEWEAWGAQAARWKRAVPRFQRLRLRETMRSLGSARILRAVSGILPGTTVWQVEWSF
jgi:hypothetical protein